jgi:hypothetical protein
MTTEMPAPSAPTRYEYLAPAVYKDSSVRVVITARPSNPNPIQSKPLASASHLQPRPSPAAALVGLHRKREAYTATLTELEQAIGGVLYCG